MSPVLRHAALATLAAATTLLAACGGGDDDSTSGAGASGGTLTLSAAAPAANNTTLDLATAGTSGNSARAADTFSSLPYCEVYFENVSAANGVKYALQVYFRQGDKAPLHVSVIGANGYTVFNNAAGAAISGITVDTSARTLRFAAKVLAGSSGEAGTLDGTASFPANAGTPACGS